MDSDALILLGLVALVAVNVVLRVREEVRGDALLRKVSTVLDVLVVWAHHWGRPAEEVKPLLLAALKARRQVDRVAARQRVEAGVAVVPTPPVERDVSGQIIDGP